MLEQSLAENYRLLDKMKEASNDLEEIGFTEDEKDSMKDIQDYVDGRNKS